MKPLAENKKAYFNYEILDRFQAGISLIGQEVKSIKSGRINLAGSFVVLRGEEAYLVGANVPAYQPKHAPRDYDPERSKKLLLRKAEIKKLIGKCKERGLTLVPLRVYAIKGRIKIEFGVAKGRKKIDKRELIRKRETEREIEKQLKIRG